MDKKPCHIHVSFSGCEKNFFGEFIQIYAIANELPLWAGWNDMIIVYPSSKCWNKDGDIDVENIGTIDHVYMKAVN